MQQEDSSSVPPPPPPTLPPPEPPFDRSPTALRVLSVACLLGLAGDLLLRETTWSLNFAIFGLLFVGSLLWLARRCFGPPEKSALPFAIPIALFALLFVWRDAPELRIANFTAMALAAGALAIRTRKGHIGLGSVVDYSFGPIGAWIATPVYFCMLAFDDVRWAERSSWIKTGRAAAVARGLALAVPIVIVFGGLFASADARFRDMVDASASMDGEQVVLHLFAICVTTILVGGLLRAIFLPSEPVPQTYPQQPPMDPPRLGITELSIVLGALNLVFALFVTVQFAHLFGGHSLVQTTDGLTYAEYARSGFFELVAVAAITLPMLLIMHAMLDKRDSEKPFLWLARCLVGLVFVVMASALYRMMAYVDSYGLTTLRLYTSAFIVWLGLTFLWLLVTQLWGRPQRFAFGAVVAGLASVLALNVMNPDGFIARVNTGMGGKALDAAYLSSLSADAVPTLVQAMPSMPADKRQILHEALTERWGNPQSDWREFNFGRLAAVEAISPSK